MARTLALGNLFDGGRGENGGGLMEDLAVSVKENYSTFSQWNDPRERPEPAATLAGRLAANHAAFRRWDQPRA